VGTISLQFVEGTGVGSAMIKWFGHGKFSHVDCVLPDGSLLGARSDVIQGVPAGVQIRPAGYMTGPVERVDIPCTAEQEQMFYSYGRSQIGRAYNQLGIIAFVFSVGWTNEEERFCSEFATMCLRGAGMLGQLSEPPNKIDPDSLRLILSAVWGK
jgi:hypothetical protein